MDHHHDALEIIKDSESVDYSSSSLQRISRTKTSPACRRRDPSCGSSLALIEIVSPVEMPVRRPKFDVPAFSRRRWSYPPQRLNDPGMYGAAHMIYNEYGELVDTHSLFTALTPNDLNVTQLLRVLKKAYYHDFRKRLNNIIIFPPTDEQNVKVVEDGLLLGSDRSSFGKLKLGFEDPNDVSSSKTPITGPVLHGPSRALEIGCSDGSWCFKFKSQQPDWIVEGVDDTDHWSCVHTDIPLKDFTTSVTGHPGDYFNGAHTFQRYPTFSTRDLNQLVAHKEPIPLELYDLIRALDIFDRVENCKAFLDDIRNILQPDGVVEFIEIDPFPRHISTGALSQKGIEDHTSGPALNWTNNTSDRLKDIRKEPLAETVPGWVSRVEQRLKASLRPLDGVPASNLKTWLEGVGFCDVKQLIIRLVVGGPTASGQSLKEFLVYQVKLENELPKLRAELPEIEATCFEDGQYYLNLHIVTGRKPRTLRQGDAVVRQQMAAEKDDLVIRLNGEKSQHWKRLDTHRQLTTMVKMLTQKHGCIFMNGPQPRIMLPGGPVSA